MTPNSTLAARNQNECSDTTSPVQLTPCILERNERIEQYLPLVSTVLAKVRRTLPAHVDGDALYGAGVASLVAAAERFSPEQARTFPSYVRMRIKGAMIDELRRLDPNSRKARARARTLHLAVQTAEQELGRAPTDQELSARLNISLTELEAWRGRLALVRLTSLDVQPEHDSGPGSSLHDLIPDEQADVRETMELAELKQLVTDRIATLPTQQKRILAFYYFENMSYSEIGEALDLTESRICQIHKQAVATLKAYVRTLRRD